MILLPPIPDDVPRDLEHADEWLREGRCVTCGGAKEIRDVYHCDECYAKLAPSLFDYDDD